MYALLNIVVFFLLSGYAFVLMFSKPSYVKLSSKEKVLLTGREKFLLLTLVTGMIGVTGLNLSALRLMIWMLIIVLAFIIYHKHPRFNILTTIYVIFLTWLLITLFWSPSVGYGIRVFLKYLYPLMILLYAATFVHSRAFIFVAMRWMIISAFIYSIFLGGVMTHVVGVWDFYLGGVFWPMSTLNDYLAIMSGVSFVMWWRTKEKKYLFLIVWFMLSATLQSVRTGILSIGIMLMVGGYLRYKLLSLPYQVGAVVIAFTMILFVPQIKDKMFYEPDKIETIGDVMAAQDESNLNSSARFHMWEHLLQTFHQDNKWLGSGLGSVQQYMYENVVFGGLHAPHNDYVQMMSDVGNIGLLLYLLFPLSLYFYTQKYVHRRPITALSTSAILAVLSYAAVLTTMVFDNVVNYTVVSHSYPFIFIGIFFAYKRQQKLFRRRSV